ncbi:ZYRO0B14916p [Zygosaccharomyces rouxii]|uniref:ZYRO0B14916p n=1 Tax=Zygosaccharomyces rouxii (strain ATCC 2623 / CBS 732 / NBRC 1130 / NCYC 568 / NRRL Y-229) TaxID=559307 RepID=C5DS94_ZYGRC|nr:uncharacterized protein ZYRO0B14916g [Zygosaccharomyces rouxii]KAH9199816.1 putative methyltransferase-domain-containing protein [Zygosaccharomyces rouxii]CAR26655.1 ZYRO0B14916p [Zygosaccharomyces rouxii]
MDLCDLVERRCPPRKIPQYLSTPISLSVEEIGPLINEIPNSYSKRLVKILVQLWENGKLEDENEEQTLADWLYNKTIELLPYDDKQPQQDIITYAIKPGIRPKIPETPRLISHGTTGHRTWEASLYLCQYLFRQDWLPQVNEVLEIGAGTGLVSTALALAGHQVTSTDGDPMVVEQLRKTFNLNEVNIEAQVLEWGLQKPPKSDLVVAADVTYDTAVIPSLGNCLRECKTTALVACTIRNSETITFFQEYCYSIGLKATEVASTDDNDKELSCMENLTFEPLVCPIRIYRVSTQDDIK